MVKCMEGLIRSMKGDIMARCAERIEKAHDSPIHDTVPDCSKSLTFKTKNKYF